MKRMLMAAFAAAAAMSACQNGSEKKNVTDTVYASTTKQEPWVPVDSATQMQKMIEYGTPGDMHKLLAAWSGNWSGDMTMWSYEGAPPQTTKSTMTANMVMDGRYQVSRHTATMMGMPFEGTSTMAYDNATKKFSSTWIDNMSTGIMISGGDWDAGAKTLTLTGTMPDVCRPGKTCAFREVLKVVDDNNQVMDMYGPDAKTGKEYKMMEIKLMRKK